MVVSKEGQPGEPFLRNPMAALLNLHADFPHFGFKSVEHSRYLPSLFLRSLRTFPVLSILLQERRAFMDQQPISLIEATLIAPARVTVLLRQDDKVQVTPGEEPDQKKAVLLLLP
jgi:hypothetical protein